MTREPGNLIRKPGFASMDPDRQREIAAMGGRASHGGHGRDYDDDDRGRSRSRYDDDDDRGRSRSRYDDDDRGRSGRGFAAMDPDRQREIAAMGGRASHGGHGRDHDDDDRGRSRSRYDDDDDRGRSGRGFASMDPERRREFASKGGRSHDR